MGNVAKYISDEEIAYELAKSAPELSMKEKIYGMERTVQRVKRAIHEMQTVVDSFYYGPEGLDGLEEEVKYRMEYLNSVFSNPAQVKWWVKNKAALGMSDDVCRHTHEEVHYYCLNARQIAAFVRTGYNPNDGMLPEEFR